MDLDDGSQMCIDEDEVDRYLGDDQTVGHEDEMMVVISRQPDSQPDGSSGFEAVVVQQSLVQSAGTSTSVTTSANDAPTDQSRPATVTPVNHEPLSIPAPTPIIPTEETQAAQPEMTSPPAGQAPASISDHVTHGPKTLYGIWEQTQRECAISKAEEADLEQQRESRVRDRIMREKRMMEWANRRECLLSLKGSTEMLLMLLVADINRKEIELEQAQDRRDNAESCKWYSRVREEREKIATLDYELYRLRTQEAVKTSEIVEMTRDLNDMPAQEDL